MNRKEIRLSIDGLIAFKAEMKPKDRETLNTLLTQLEMAWHDFGYAKGERDGRILAEEASK